MYGNGQAPIFILKDGTQRTRGRTAQSNNIAAAKAVADAVRSTLGPKGMDKMLVDSMGDVVITNDGATILKEMDIEHPAAKMIIEVAKTQEQHCYDGTTSAVILSGELLKRSEDLIEQNVHPTVICEGFRLAAERAIGLLDSHGISTNNNDDVFNNSNSFPTTTTFKKRSGKARDIVLIFGRQQGQRHPHPQRHLHIMGSQETRTM